MSSSGDACHQLQQVITIDLGGRSTEVAMGTAGRAPQHQMSLPLGCLRASQLLQECLHHTSSPQSSGADALDALDGAADASTAHQALQDCTQQLASSDAAHQLAGILAVMKAKGRDDGSSAGDALGQASSAGAPLVVATGGTITTVSALLQRLPAYDGSKVHWSTVSREQLLGLAAEMCTGEGQERCAAACSACCDDAPCLFLRLLSCTHRAVMHAGCHAQGTVIPAAVLCCATRTCNTMATRWLAAQPQARPDSPARHFISFTMPRQ